MITSNDLTDEQKDRLRQWAEDGATLGEIQKRFSDEDGLTMTYLDARMLIADLGVILKEDREEPEETPEEEAEGEGEGESESAEAASGDEAESVSEDAPAAAGNVNVSLNEVTPPGMLASGSVTFSDGEKAEWYFDQMGRMGIDPSTEGYRPSEGDVMAFQKELEKLSQQL